MANGLDLSSSISEAIGSVGARGLTQVPFIVKRGRAQPLRGYAAVNTQSMLASQALGGCNGAFVVAMTI